MTSFSLINCLIILVPNPSYPIHPYGFLIAGAIVKRIRMTEEELFLRNLVKSITKYKNKSRILLVQSPNYKIKDYLNIKYTYQKYIKKFHKRHIKLITKIDKKGFKVKFYFIVWGLN